MRSGRSAGCHSDQRNLERIAARLRRAPGLTSKGIDVPEKVRELECGCWLMDDGTIWLVSKATGLDTENLYVRPGRFIAVDGEMDARL